MNSLVLRELSVRKIDTFLLQPVIAGNDHSYLVYLAPKGENDGHFVQEEGGVVWRSIIHPEGEPCETLLIPKSAGDEILDRIKNETEQNKPRIERY